MHHNDVLQPTQVLAGVFRAAAAELQADAVAGHCREARAVAHGGCWLVGQPQFDPMVVPTKRDSIDVEGHASGAVCEVEGLPWPKAEPVECAAVIELFIE